MFSFIFRLLTLTLSLNFKLDTKFKCVLYMFSIHTQRRPSRAFNSFCILVRHMLHIIFVLLVNPWSRGFYLLGFKYDWFISRQGIIIIIIFWITELFFFENWIFCASSISWEIFLLALRKMFIQAKRVLLALLLPKFWLIFIFWVGVGSAEPLSPSFTRYSHSHTF